MCPEFPYPCKLTRPNCRAPECIECEIGPNGEDSYNLLKTSQDMDCVSYGTKLSEETGSEYNWVI